MSSEVLSTRMETETETVDEHTKMHARNPSPEDGGEIDTSHGRGEAVGEDLGEDQTKRSLHYVRSVPIKVIEATERGMVGENACAGWSGCLNGNEERLQMKEEDGREERSSGSNREEGGSIGEKQKEDGERHVRWKGMEGAVGLG